MSAEADIYNTGSWDTVKSHSHGVNINSQTSAGGHSHGMGNTNDATVYPPFKRLYWIQCSGQQDVPIGGIIMFSLAYASRPSGFDLCNGGSYNGYATPDLRGRFIYTAESDSDVGNIGGSETHTHSQPNTNSAGAHQHGISGTTTGQSGTNTVAYQVSEGAKLAIPRSHSHTWSSTTSSDPDHVHSVPDTGAGSNLPAYVKLYFLMRTQ
jgi:microcystin-dependent protein